MASFKNIQNQIEEKIIPVAGKISEQRHLSAMKEGLMSTLPLTIIGGIALILVYPPVDTEIIKPTNIFNNFLLAWKTWANANSTTLLAPYNMTLGLLGLFSVIAVSYFLLDKYKMNKITGVMTSLLTFLLVASPGEALSTKYLDAKGIFLGVIIAFTTVEITRILFKKGMKIKLPDEVPPMVSAPFEALIPVVLNIFLFMFLNNILISSTGLSMPEIVLKIFTPLVVASNTLPGIILVMLLINILWFFGIHGGAVVNSVIVPLATANLAVNAEAVAQGQPLPYIFSGRFVNLFANLGGAGAALALVIAMIIVAKSVHLKSVSKVGITPAIFGISEPLVFSTPMVLNPLLLIPMIVVPVLNTTISYFAATTGLIGKIYVNVPFTTPGPLGPFLATMDWRVAVLWGLMIILDVIIYMPFVRAYDKQMLNQEQVTSSN